MFRREEGDDADTIVLFDANLPELKRCKHGCRAKGRYWCRHRFDKAVFLIDKPNLFGLTRMKDIQVALFFIALIKYQWHDRAKIPAKRYYIATHDGKFVGSAKGVFQSDPKMASLPITFGPDWVQYAHQKKSVRVYLLHIPTIGHQEADRDLEYLRDEVNRRRKSATP